MSLWNYRWIGGTKPTFAALNNISLLEDSIFNRRCALSHLLTKSNENFGNGKLHQSNKIYIRFFLQCIFFCDRVSCDHLSFHHQRWDNRAKTGGQKILLEPYGVLITENSIQWNCFGGISWWREGRFLEFDTPSHFTPLPTRVHLQMVPPVNKWARLPSTLLPAIASPRVIRFNKLKLASLKRSYLLTVQPPPPADMDPLPTNPIPPPHAGIPKPQLAITKANR